MQNVAEIDILVGFDDVFCERVDIELLLSVLDFHWVERDEKWDRGRDRFQSMD